MIKFFIPFTIIFVLLIAIAFYFLLFTPLTTKGVSWTYGQYNSIFCDGVWYETCQKDYDSYVEKDAANQSSKVALGLISICTIGFVYITTSAGLFVYSRMTKNKS